MPIGPGKYDSLCTKVREESNAEAVIVIVFNGDHGTGFSVQAVGRDMTAILPTILRNTANQIEQSTERKS